MDYWIWTIVCVILTYVFVKVYEKSQHFKKFGVPQPSEIPYIGIMGLNILRKRHVINLMKDIYDMNKEAKYIGCHMFANPVIVPRDLDLIKTIFVKNFDHFSEHKTFVDERTDPLFGKNLAFINGEKWREVRNLLTPTFTSSKMRTMFELMSRCADNFTKQFLTLYAEKNEIDMKDVFARYANDVIATCAFGIEVDSIKNPDNEFYIYGRRAVSFNFGTLLRVFVIRAFPNLAKIIGVRFISKKDTDFFVNVISDTIKTREEKGIARPDMLQLLMDARNKNEDFNIMDITAQAFIFFLGGFETTSGQMCLIAHELAVNPDVQEKLQVEIDEVMEKTNGDPSYEDVNDMPYLDAVFNESIRMHSIGFINRMCTKDFELPPALPGSKPYLVKTGMEIMVPIPGVHKDPEIYENPDKFYPERFLGKKVKAGDATLLGFGLGPRMCIGNRFAILETKILFVRLLYKCSFVVCDKTSNPFEYMKSSLTPNAKGGFWLKIKTKN